MLVDDGHGAFARQPVRGLDVADGQALVRFERLLAGRARLAGSPGWQLVVNEALRVGQHVEDPPHAIVSDAMRCRRRPQLAVSVTRCSKLTGDRTRNGSTAESSGDPKAPPPNAMRYAIVTRRANVMTSLQVGA